MEWICKCDTAMCNARCEVCTYTICLGDVLMWCMYAFAILLCLTLDAGFMYTIRLCNAIMCCMCMCGMTRSTFPVLHVCYQRARTQLLSQACMPIDSPD
jgi:hypothetical protein